MIKTQKRTEECSHAFGEMKGKTYKFSVLEVTEMPVKDKKCFLEIARLKFLISVIPQDARLKKEEYNRAEVADMQLRYRSGYKWAKLNGYNNTNLLDVASQCLPSCRIIAELAKAKGV